MFEVFNIILIHFSEKEGDSEFPEEDKKKNYFKYIIYDYCLELAIQEDITHQN